MNFHGVLANKRLSTDRLCTTPVLDYPDFKISSILITDASKIAVAAVLSKVKDGLERPIAYASCQMNTATIIFSFRG